jgi:hypothetical protein
MLGVWHDLGRFEWVILLSFVDPVVVAIGLWMGWHADQPGKILLAGLAAGLAGIVVAAVLGLVGLTWMTGGVPFYRPHVLFRVIAGFLWAAIGYGARRVRG